MLSKKALNITGNVLFISILIFSLLMIFFTFQAKTSGEVPSIFGYKLYVVLSGSMEPSMHTGSLAVVKEAPVTSLTVGDVITFRNLDSGKLITHRIVRVNNSGSMVDYTTRGDANDTDDFTAVKPEDIIGKVSYSVPFVGSFMEIARTKEGILAFVIIPGAIIMMLEVRKLFKYAILADRKKQAEKSAWLAAKVEEKDHYEGSDTTPVNSKEQ